METLIATVLLFGVTFLFEMLFIYLIIASGRQPQFHPFFRRAEKGIRTLVTGRYWLLMCLGLSSVVSVFTFGRFPSFQYPDDSHTKGR